MKLKQLIFVIALVMVQAGPSLAADFYPELGMDPFYSSFNPAYIDKEEFDSKDDTVVDFIKNRKGDNKQSAELFVEPSNDVVVEPNSEPVVEPEISPVVETTVKQEVTTKSATKNSGFFGASFMYIL